MEEPVARPEVLVRRDLDVADGDLGLGQCGRGAAGHTDDADLGDVALEQGIGRLGRAVGNERDVLGADAGLSEYGIERRDHAGGDAIGMAVGGRHGMAPDDLARAALSIRTALVKVPPTSIPMRNDRRCGCSWSMAWWLARRRALVLYRRFRKRPCGPGCAAMSGGRAWVPGRDTAQSGGMAMRRLVVARVLTAGRGSALKD